jgi:hypothetical protein
MPRKFLKNRKLSPWLTEGVEHWRWLEDRLHPLFEVTSPKYSGAWMDEVETRGLSELRRRLAEHRFIERMRRIERNRIIDKMLAEANQYAQRQHERRQRIIDRLLKDALAGNLPPYTAGEGPMDVKSVWLDKDNGRAEVVLGSPDGTFFVIWRDAAGTWADGNAGPPFSPSDTFENFSVISGKEAAILSQEALAAVPSPKPIRNKAASSGSGSSTN